MLSLAQERLWLVAISVAMMVSASAGAAMPAASTQVPTPSARPTIALSWPVVGVVGQTPWLAPPTAEPEAASPAEAAAPEGRKAPAASAASRPHLQLSARAPPLTPTPASAAGGRLVWRRLIHQQRDGRWRQWLHHPPLHQRLLAGQYPHRRRESHRDHLLTRMPLSNRPRGLRHDRRRQSEGNVEKACWACQVAANDAAAGVIGVVAKG